MDGLKPEILSISKAYAWRPLPAGTLFTIRGDKW